MRTGKRIFKNMLSLSVAEIANKGIALISTAYLARVILPEGNGIVGWANSFVVYFILFVELGFSVIGPREIARFPEKIRKLVNNITTIRFSIALISFLLLSIIVFFINKPFEVKCVVMIAGLNIFSSVFLYNWVFQGIEKMEVIAIRQVTTSIINLVGLLILVHSPSDIIIAMTVKIGAMILNTLWMLMYYIKLYGKIHFEYDKALWKELIHSSIPIALTLFLTGLYNNFGIFLLGVMRSEKETGMFYVAVMVMAFSIVPSGIIQQAFMPQLSRSLTLNDKLKFTEKYALFTFIIGVIVTAGFFTFSDYIIQIGFGSSYNDSSLILKILMISALLAYMNVSYFAPLMSWNYEKKLFWVMATGGIVNLIFNLILVPYYGAVGAGIAAIFTEFAVLLGLASMIYIEIKRLFIIKFITVLLYAVLSCLIGYILMQFGFHPLICGSISLLIYIFINFLLKTITIDEIKLYLSKN